MIRSGFHFKGKKRVQEPGIPVETPQRFGHLKGTFRTCFSTESLALNDAHYSIWIFERLRSISDHFE